MVLRRKFQGEDSCGQTDRHVLVTINRFSPKEMQAVDNGPIICIPLLNVRMTGSQVSSNETEAGVVVIESDANSTFVTRHAA
jgi:hypothetical protein